MPSLFVTATNEQTGEVAFQTGSTFLDGSVFCILVVCESLESTMPEHQRIAYDRYTVNFQIDCTTDEIQFVQDYNEVDYYITADPQMVPVMPIFTQTFSACPVQCSVTSSAFGYQQPDFVTNVNTATGHFSISENDQMYINQRIPTTVYCESVLSGSSASDTFDIVFKDIPNQSGTNPCLNDQIMLQAEIQDFTYTISYPANQLLVNVDYNQQIGGCPVVCNLLNAGYDLPEPPFTTYGTSGIFSVFTSNSGYDGNAYNIDVVCQSVLSNQPAITSSFTITFVHDQSASDASNYSGCANDRIYWSSDLTDFELPVSSTPPDYVYTPYI